VNKSPLKTSGTVAICVLRRSCTFSGHWAHRAVTFATARLSCFEHCSYLQPSSYASDFRQYHCISHQERGLLADLSAHSMISSALHYDVVCIHVCPSVRPSVALCIVAHSVQGLAQTVKSCAVVFQAGNFLLTSSATFAIV